MKIKTLTGQNALVEKIKIESASQFASGNDVDKNSPAYTVKYVGKDFTFTVGQQLLLKPGQYDQIQTGTEILVPIDNEDVLGTVEV